MSTDSHKIAEQLRSAARQRMLAVLVERTESLNFAVASWTEPRSESGNTGVPHDIYGCIIVAINSRGRPISLEDGLGRVGTIIGFTMVKITFSASTGEIVISGNDKSAVSFVKGSFDTAMQYAEQWLREYQPPD